MQMGIVGLSLSGKTTLFNALTRAHADRLHHGGAKREAHHGVVKVPEPRLAELQRIFQRERVVPTTVEYVDSAGFEKGVSEKGGFPEQFLAQLRTVDALLVVLRLFENPAVPHPEGSIDPVRDFQIVQSEFLLSDYAIVESRVEKLTKTLAKTKREEEERQLVLLERCLAALEQEHPLRELEFSPEEAKHLRGYQFLTAKPLLIVLNIGEQEIGHESEVEQQFAALRPSPQGGLLAVCAEMEMEIAQLSEDDARVFREDLGMREPALERLIRCSYELLGLISFFTTEGNEVRAWTLRRGTPARAAAGTVHTDMERGFIRAEVAHYDDLIRCGSVAKCRDQGLLRLEGKDYIVQDGDVITFRFKV